MLLNRQSWTTMWVLAALLAGAILRVGYFASDTALWGDEAAIALNLQSKTYAGLFQPLAHNQHAPVGFLLTEKWLFEQCGLNERCLRLPALVASLLALPAFVLLVRALTASEPTRLLAVLMVCLSPALVRYAAELKPYAIDVLATVLISHATIRSLGPPVSRRLVVLWAFASAAVVWFSFASVIVLLGCGVATFVTTRDRGVRSLLRAGIPLAVGAVSFLSQYTLVARHSVANPELLEFWSYAFIPFPPSSLWDVRHTVSLIGRAFRDPLGLADSALPSALAVFGGYVLQRELKGAGTVLVLPVVVVAALSAAHLWPFATRLVLFLTPALAVLVAAGCARAISTLPGRLAIPITALALVGPQVAGVRDALGGRERSGIRDVLRRVKDEVREGDTVYVYYKSRLTFELYREPALGDRRIDVIFGRQIDGDATRIDADVQQLVGRSRLWVILSEVNRWAIDEDAILLAKLDTNGRRLQAHAFAGAAATLYDTTSTTP